MMSLDPSTKKLLDEMATNPAPPLDQTPIGESRATLKELMLRLDRPPVSGVVSREVAIANVPVTMHSPEAGHSLPIAVFIHGGGFARGDREMYDGMCRYFAKAAHCIVLNVEYRLAPEHPFPAGLQDSYDVVKWAAAHGAELGGDGSRLAVLGDSAGGNFTAVIAHMARADGILLAAQGLLYPGVDLRCHSDYPSRRAYGGGYYFLDLERLYWYFERYLPNTADANHWWASPLLAKDFSGLAPAFILTAGCDPLCDEGRLYADALTAAGTPVVYKCYPGTIHGFLSFAKAIPMGLEGQQWVAAQLRAALGAE